MKKTSLYDYVIEQLAITKGSWPEVAEGSGVSKRTLEKIARKENKDPRISSIQKLADYFQRKQGKAA